MGHLLGIPAMWPVEVRAVPELAAVACCCAVPPCMQASEGEARTASSKEVVFFMHVYLVTDAIMRGAISGR